MKMLQASKKYFNSKDSLNFIKKKQTNMFFLKFPRS